MTRSFAILLAAACNALSSAQPLPCEGWATIPGQTNPYHEGSAYAVTYFDFDGAGPEPAQLVIGGEQLDLIGADAGTLFRWDGERWHPIGDPFDASVYSLQVFGGELYAGGDFSTVSGNPTPLLARWRDGRWQSVTASDGRSIQRRAGDLVRAMHIHGGRLVVAGRFGLTGQSTACNIASWDGASFGEYGSGIEGSVRAMTTHRGDLVVGGAFTRAGGQTMNCLARWNGAAWRPVGPTAVNQGANGPVRALASFEGSLYIGGDFAGVGSPVFSAPSFVALSDFGWIRSGGGVSSGNVRALLPTSNGLIVAGAFRTVGGVAHRGLATLRNDVWSRELGDVPLPDPDLTIPPSIGAMIEHDGTIAFAGQFDGAGGAGGNLVVGKSATRWISYAPDGLAGGVVKCSALFRGEYYIGGSFRSSGGDILGGLAKWNGRRWIAVPSWDATSDVTSLLVGDDKLWVGGRLNPLFSVDQPGEVLAAVFDGNSWHWAPARESLSRRTTRAVYWNGRIVMPGPNGPVAWSGQTWEQLPAQTPSRPGNDETWLVTLRGELYSVSYPVAGPFIVRYQNGYWLQVSDAYVDPWTDPTMHEERLVLHAAYGILFWDGAPTGPLGGFDYINTMVSANGRLYIQHTNTFQPPYPESLVRYVSEEQFAPVPRFNPRGNEGRPIGDFFGNLLATHPTASIPRPDTDSTAVFISGPPTVIGQPLATAACPHQPLRLDVVAVGMGMTFQWRRDGVPIEYATKNVYEDVFPGDSRPGLYDCVITNACGEVISEAVRYAPCPADHDCNGFVDFFDYADFVTDLETGSSKADTNHDGFIDAFDYAVFVESFETGC